MHDDPRATDEELEQGPDRIEAEEEMRGPGGADSELPAVKDDEDGEDDE
ncbi:MAG TPA: hypothetical protein VFO81_01920 [Gaiellaceae bacterium]|nr:hypothetical protein [Gaiellaceae bacterium]